MTKDKDIKTSLKLLDKTINYLIENCTNYRSSFNNLYKHIYFRDLSIDKEFHATGYLKLLSNQKITSLTDFAKIDISNNTRAEGEKLVEACYFLNNKGYIRLDSDFKMSVTFDGLIQYGKGGLLKKFKSEKYKKWLDHFNVYVTIAISLVSLLLGTWIGYLAL